MDCEVTTNYSTSAAAAAANGNGTSTTNTATVTTNGKGSSSPNGSASSNGLSSSSTSTTSSSSRHSNGSTKSQQHHVDFIETVEVKEKREKYLTAKYGSHQMNLIRKRLSVEMWLYDEIQKLFEAETNGESNSVASSTETSAMTKSQSYLNNTSTPEVEIDLDEVLDLDNDVERRKFIKSQLSEAKKPQEVVNKFIDDLLEKARTL